MLHFFQAAKPTALGILRRDVPARLPDGRQHLRRHPVLEHPSLRQLRREHQGVETAFVDDDGLALVVRTSVANRDGGFVFIIYVFAQCIACITIPPMPQPRPYLRTRSRPAHRSWSGLPESGDSLAFFSDQRSIP